MTWEDLQSWCDELSLWIIELGEEEEVRKAWPKGVFPLQASPEKDDIDEDKDVLAYITIWVCCKICSPAPAGLHSRILLAGPFKGPWQELYIKLLKGWDDEDYKDIDIFGLAS